MTPKNTLRVVATLALISLLAACGSNKKSISMKVHSDPQGAYAMIQVTNKNNENADWIFLGPTPIVTNRKMTFKDASNVSLKVIRPGFFEQTKTWSVKDFLKEHRQNKEVVWVPNMVKQ